MADPIIMDDGGSTRIKHYRTTTAAGDMPDLMTVTGNNPPQSHQDLPNPLGAFTNLEVIFINPVTGKPTTSNTAVAANDVILVTSGVFSVQVTIGQDHTGAAVAGGSTILVTGVAGVVPIDPQVEVKQHRDQAGVKRRRYIIANAPPIDKITVNGNPPLFSAAATPSAYTTIVLT